MVVHSGDDCVVMAIPRHHGDFGFEVAFLFARWLNSEPGEERDPVRTILHASTSEQSDFPLIILLLALVNERPAGSFTGTLHHAVHGSNKTSISKKKL